MLFVLSSLVLSALSVTQDQTSLQALSNDAARCSYANPNEVYWPGIDQCTEAVKRYTGSESWTVEEISNYNMPCGCFFDEAASKIRYNEFQHPCWCWGNCGMYDNGDGMGDNAMAKQDAQAASDDYIGLCRTYPTDSIVTNSVFDSDKEGVSFSLSISEARCSYDNTIKNVELCVETAQALGIAYQEVVEVSGWAWPCGCHFNPVTGALQFNSFVHPYYCYANEEVEGNDRGTKDLGPRGTVTGNYLRQDAMGINSIPICYEEIKTPMFDYVQPEVLPEDPEEPEEQAAPSDLGAMFALGQSESTFGTATVYGLAAIGLGVTLYNAGSWLARGQKYSEVVEMEC